MPLLSRNKAMPVAVIVVFALLLLQGVRVFLRSEHRPTTKANAASSPGETRPKQDESASKAGPLGENFGALDASLRQTKGSRKDRSSEGNVTRRKTSSRKESASTEKPQQSPASLRLRIEGKGGGQAPKTAPVGKEHDEAKASPEARTMDNCFCPYGRPIKCELVFTLDSTTEESPFVGLVTEPVYNNGYLVIPAGAELHGMARPDRLRDRIFSASEWVLLFPRTRDLPNGRQIRVKGIALDRDELPNRDAWGPTDGSAGLRGQVIRTLEAEEVRRFASTFLATMAMGMQERESTGRGGTRYTNSPANAALQGLSGMLEQLSRDILEEVKRHGVFLRVPGGKQFYFYPQQSIHPAAAYVPQEGL